MAESADALTTTQIPTAHRWRRVTRYYRRPLGLGWLVGLVVVPLLLGAIGYGLQDRPVSRATGAVPAPGQRVPAISLAPASIVRAGDTITLRGQFPDQKARAGLVDAVSASLPAGVTVVDQLGINPDVTALDFSDAAKVFSSAAPIADFRLIVQGETVTLAGTAATGEQHDAVLQAARDTWPNLNIVDTMAGAPAPGGDCADVARAVAAALPAPITFGVDAATLTLDAEPELRDVATKLTACPTAKVTVTGYSDDTGDDGINVPLSDERAAAVADFLAANGVPRGRLTVRGLGAADPVAGNDTPEGRAQNRRVEIAVG